MSGVERCVFFPIKLSDPVLTDFLSSNFGAFCNARIISIAGPNPRTTKGTPRGVTDALSHNTDRWTIHLLQRGQASTASFLIVL